MGGKATHHWRDGIEGKVCWKCKKWKTLDGFHRNRSRADGLQDKCKECRSRPPQKTAHKWQDGVEGKVCGTCREWKPLKRFFRHRDHWDGISTTCKACGAARLMQWEAANPEKKAEYGRRHRERHREHERARLRQWRQNNPCKNAAKSQRYRARKLDVTIKLVDREAVFERDGHTCVYCGSTENSELDHVVPLSRGGPHCEDNLVVACRRCNASKGAKLLEEWEQCNGDKLLGAD